MARTKTPREAPEVAEAIRRQVRALGRRIAAGDVEDLAELVAIRQAADEALAAAATALTAGTHGTFGTARYSYTDVGRVLGISRQAARQRFTA